jgi:2'-5' RNA ligase
MSGAASVGGDAKVRVFCALTLPEDVLDRIVRWQEATLRRLDVRIVPRENLHVTLAFLGSTPEAALGAIGDALQQAAESAKPIEFLEPKRPVRQTRSVGMLLLRDLRGSALALAEDLFTRLEHLGVYEREKKPWLPHITVMRFRRPPGVSLDHPSLGGRIVPSDAAVYLSKLRPTGAEYVVVQKFGLGGS